MYISYRGQSGKATGYYVPTAAESEVRRGLEAWIQLQTQLRQLSALNKSARLKPLVSKNRCTFATGFRLAATASYSDDGPAGAAK
jgi:hypothetical protein